MSATPVGKRRVWNVKTATPPSWLAFLRLALLWRKRDVIRTSPPNLNRPDLTLNAPKALQWLKKCAEQCVNARDWTVSPERTLTRAYTGFSLEVAAWRRVSEAGLKAASQNSPLFVLQIQIKMDVCCRGSSPELQMFPTHTQHTDMHTHMDTHIH